MITWLSTIGKLEMALKVQPFMQNPTVPDEDDLSEIRRTANCQWKLINSIFDDQDQKYISIGNKKGANMIQIFNRINLEAPLTETLPLAERFASLPKED